LIEMSLLLCCWLGFFVVEKRSRGLKERKGGMKKREGSASFYKFHNFESMLTNNKKDYQSLEIDFADKASCDIKNKRNKTDNRRSRTSMFRSFWSSIPYRHSHLPNPNKSKEVHLNTTNKQKKQNKKKLQTNKETKNPRTNSPMIKMLLGVGGIRQLPPELQMFLCLALLNQPNRLFNADLQGSGQEPS